MVNTTQYYYVLQILKYSNDIQKYFWCDEQAKAKLKLMVKRLYDEAPYQTEVWMKFNLLFLYYWEIILK